MTAAPERLGRFVLSGEIGRGGMGIVYKGFDPDLRREVAVKVLDSSALDDASLSAGAARLAREAQAMARLKHPHVAVIHEVGIFEQRLFLVMEYIEGESLRQWLKRAPSTTQIVDCFLQAARGLAEAHRSGLVHRDFKPENVMRDHEGRARVMDFGLAREMNGRLGVHHPPGEITCGDSPDSPLTASGAILGTPAYMAPEQHRGKGGDARSDQFAFCVALYEALVGERPFAGNTYLELSDNVIRGQRRVVPRTWRRQRRLLAVLDRGLSVSPEDRFPSMDDLLGALSRTQRRPGVTSIAFGGAALALVAAWSFVPSNGACESVEEGLAGIWDATRRGAVEDTIRRSPKPYADAVWRSTSRLLDAQATRWIEAATELCGARLVRAEDVGSAFDARSECLDDRRVEFAALSDALLHGDDAILLEASAAAGTLSDVDACVDPRRVRRGEGPVPSALRGRLVHGRVAHALGKDDEAMTSVVEVLASVDEARQPGISAEALILRADLEGRKEELPEAEASLRRAASLAQSSANHEIRAMALIRLVYILGIADRYAEAERLASEAETVLEVLGAAPILRAQLLANRSVAARHAGQFDDALSRYHEALAIFDEEYGAGHPATARTRANVGTLLFQMGRVDEATAMLEAALGSFEAVFGVGHPWIATVLASLANAYAIERRFDESIALYRRSLAIREAQFPDGHPSLARGLYNLAQIELRRGDYASAAESIARGRATLALQRSIDAQAQARWDLLEGTVAFHLGRHDRALECISKAVEAMPELETLSVAMMRWTLLARSDLHAAIARATNDGPRLSQGPADTEQVQAWMSVMLSVRDLVTHDVRG